MDFAEKLMFWVVILTFVLFGVFIYKLTTNNRVNVGDCYRHDNYHYSIIIEKGKHSSLVKLTGEEENIIVPNVDFSYKDKIDCEFIRK